MCPQIWPWLCNWMESGKSDHDTALIIAIFRALEVVIEISILGGTKESDHDTALTIAIFRALEVGVEISILGGTKESVIVGVPKKYCLMPSQSTDCIR